MLQRGEAESRTACAVLVAIDEHEITIGEFADAVDLLTPEALQVIATALRSCAEMEPRHAEQIWRAQKICSQLASATRVLS
jgi:hypothetical protein